MPISNYATLKSELIAKSKRTDLSDDDIATIVQMTEEKLDTAKLRLVAEETQLEATLETNDRYLALPPRFQKMRDIRIKRNGELYPLTYRTANRLHVRSGTGTPRNYTITDTIEFDVIPETNFEVSLWFFRDIEPLDPANEDSTNTILTKYPMLYLYGALEEVFFHILDEARANIYAQKFAMLVNMVNDKEDEARFAVAASMTAPGATP